MQSHIQVKRKKKGNIFTFFFSLITPYWTKDTNQAVLKLLVLRKSLKIINTLDWYGIRDSDITLAVKTTLLYRESHCSLLSNLASSFTNTFEPMLWLSFLSFFHSSFLNSIRECCLSFFLLWENSCPLNKIK